MKKIAIICLCMMLVAALALPALAAPQVVFTSDSEFAVGGKVTVDIMAMTDMDSAIYNAWLENDVQYQWYSNSSQISGATGKSLTIKESDRGTKLFVEVICWDMELVSTTYLIDGVKYTVDSKFAVGSHVAVDIDGMMNMDSAIYNAVLEGQVKYQWYLDGAKISGATGKSYTVKAADEGKVLSAEVYGIDLVVTSEGGIVAGQSAPTTQPTTAPNTQPTTAPNTESTTAPTTESTAITTTQITTQPTTTGNPGGETSTSSDSSPIPDSTATDDDEDDGSKRGNKHNNGGSSLWWLWIVIAVVAVGGIVFFVIFISKKGKTQ